MSEVEKNASDNISRILVGNKCDLESQRAVSKEEGQELASHYGVRFIETSALSNQNVEQAFTLMSREVKERVAHTNPTPGGRGGKPSGPQALKPGRKVEKKPGCC